MGTFALVIYEIQEKDKATDVIYVTYGEIGTTFRSEPEIIAWAKNYIHNPNAVYKGIKYLSEEQYKSYSSTQILDYSR